MKHLFIILAMIIFTGSCYGDNQRSAIKHKKEVSERVEKMKENEEISLNKQMIALYKKSFRWTNFCATRGGNAFEQKIYRSTGLLFIIARMATILIYQTRRIL